MTVQQSSVARRIHRVCMVQFIDHASMALKLKAPTELIFSTVSFMVHCSYKPHNHTVPIRHA